MALTLCYWNVRGHGETTRYLLRYSGLEWKNDVIPVNEEGFARWGAEKFELGLGLPNLPYLIDGEMKVTQSLAIVRYLGRKLGLVPGEDEREVVRCEMIEQDVVDLRDAFQKHSFDEKFEENMEVYLDKMEGKLKILDGYLGDGPFAMGEKLTYVDFMLFEFVSQIRKLAPERVEKAGNVVKLLQNFRDLPQLQDFFNSEEFTTTPIHPPFAKFVGE